MSVLIKIVKFIFLSNISAAILICLFTSMIDGDSLISRQFHYHSSSHFNLTFYHLMIFLFLKKMSISSLSSLSASSFFCKYFIYLFKSLISTSLHFTSLIQSRTLRQTPSSIHGSASYSHHFLVRTTQGSRLRHRKHQSLRRCERSLPHPFLLLLSHRAPR